jgi:hypothetical protein
MGVRWLAAATVIGAVMTAAPPAAAGGSWLETEQSYYAPGDHAVARGVFGDGSYKGTVDDGPFNLYLVPGYRWLPRNEPIPEWAVLLGPLTIRPADGQYCCWVASADFTVPDVASGRYSLDYCNDPCTVDGIGDLLGGSFFVGESEQEARLMGRIERLRIKVEALAPTKRDLRKTEAALAQVQERYDTLVGRLRAMRPDESSPREETEPADRPVPAWAVVAGLIVLTGGAWFRRRLGRTAIPDFVPDELLRDAHSPPRLPMTSLGRPAISMPAPPRNNASL